MGDTPCGPGSPTREVLAACIRGDAAARGELIQRARSMLPVLRHGLGMPQSTARDVLLRASAPDALRALHEGGSLGSADEVLVASVVREIQRRDRAEPWPIDASLHRAHELAALADTALLPRLTFFLYYWSDMAISRIAAVLEGAPAMLSEDCDRIFELLDYYEELAEPAPVLELDSRIRLHGMPQPSLLGFHARTRELAALQDAWNATLLGRGPGVFAVLAGTGMGKSALALHWLARLRQRDRGDQPQLIFGWNFAAVGHAGWTAFVDELQAALPGKLPGTDPEALARGLASTRSLLILDGCRADADASPELIAFLAAMRRPAGPGQSLCIALGERPLRPASEPALHLGPLSAGACARLLRENFGLTDSEEFLRELGVALAGNPAALCAVGEHAAATSATALLGDGNFVIARNLSGDPQTTDPRFREWYRHVRHHRADGWSVLAFGDADVTALVELTNELLDRRALASVVPTPTDLRVLREASAREVERAKATNTEPSPPPDAASLIYVVTCIPEPGIRDLHPKILRQMRQHLRSGHWQWIEDSSGADIARAHTAKAIVVLYCMDIDSTDERRAGVKALVPDLGPRMLVLTLDHMQNPTPDALLKPINDKPLGGVPRPERDKTFVALCRELDRLRA